MNGNDFYSLRQIALGTDLLEYRFWPSDSWCDCNSALRSTMFCQWKTLDVVSTAATLMTRVTKIFACLWIKSQILCWLRREWTLSMNTIQYNVIITQTEKNEMFPFNYSKSKLYLFRNLKFSDCAHLRMILLPLFGILLKLHQQQSKQTEQTENWGSPPCAIKNAEKNIEYVKPHNKSRKMWEASLRPCIRRVIS